MFCQTNENTDQEISSIKKLVASNVDGLLVSVSNGSSDVLEFEKIKQKGIPIVMYDRILHEFECSKVIVDEYEGAYKAVEHLIQNGCRRIAHIGGPQCLSVSVNRLNGYLDALRDNGMAIDQQLIAHCAAFEEDALDAVGKILSAPLLPDGLFCINDLSAILALKYVVNKGLKVPKQMKIVGFNDDPVSRFAEPSLTTVMQPGYEVGKLAMGILIDEIQNRELPYQTVKLRTSLIVRDSSTGGE
jgi:DNA-binding LacI/PurR family transcriptional regulator